MRKHIAKILVAQARRYLKKSDARVVVVVGSVGKTSTTQAIATLLSQSYSLHRTLKNYNTDIGVPLSVFQKHLPSQLKNPLAWVRIMVANELTLLRSGKANVLVLELGTDAPGEIEQFDWLQPEIAVVTAITPEHMEYFKTLEAVAREELAVASYSKYLLVNERMVDQRYLVDVDTTKTTLYSRSGLADFQVNSNDLQVVGEHSVDAVVAAATVGKMFGLTAEQIQQGATQIIPQKGRMNVLSGVHGSTLIDDTYNAAPAAVRAALKYLYSVDAPQRIVLLGNMNELGDTSPKEHALVGDYCDPDKLDLVVTLGPDANTYTAPAARDKNCQVIETQTPYQAAEVIKKHLKPGAHVLLKGSQNAVFAEEATLLLLEKEEDVVQLVRQSQFWKAKKQMCFKDVATESL